MTTDAERWAWVTFYAATLTDPNTTIATGARLAEEALAEYRKRWPEAQETAWTPERAATNDAAHFAVEWFAQKTRSEALVKERDEQRARAEAAEAQVKRLERDRDEYRAGAQGWMEKCDAATAEVARLESVVVERANECHRLRKLVRDALGAVARHMAHCKSGRRPDPDRSGDVCPCQESTAVLSRAKAAGFEVEP